MASGPGVPRSAVGPIGAEDILDDSPVMGPVVRSTKYCKVHSVVASSWEAESAEAHVFQPTGKAQARFLNRSVWPKLRKSHGFKREIKKDDGCIIFIVADNTKIEKEQLLFGEANTSTLPTPRQLPAGFSPSTVGNSIFLRYLEECHGDEPPPAFQSDGFPTPAEPKATEVKADLQMLKRILRGSWRYRHLSLEEIVDKTWRTPLEPGASEVKAYELEMIKSILRRRWLDRRFSPADLVDKTWKTPLEHVSANNAIPASWEEDSDTGTRRSKPRQIPQQRCLHFVLSLAADIAEEPLDYDADGVCLFGHSFMSKHLYPRQIGMLSSQALSQHAARQRAWMNHIERTLHHLPGLLKKQEAVAERAWLVSLGELRRIFSDQAADDQLSEQQRRQNVAIMKWIVERSFSGFGPEAVASLAESFTCHTCDGEPATQWMLRIRGNAGMRRWAGQELLKAPDAPEKANSVLMRLLEAQMTYELVLGMKPLLDRMHLVSQEELKDCEWSAAIHTERDKAELERVSNRWEARFSVLKTKRIA